jgi:hypothetical protein
MNRKERNRKGLKVVRVLLAVFASSLRPLRFSFSFFFSVISAFSAVKTVFNEFDSLPYPLRLQVQQVRETTPTS